ncbi:hypothetical protein BOO71_0004447 [Deinococcus marmoris]|uniref:Uncharacterized protein n=1 Tax=Deinococcus marmoris TaxID=249408 RepID=A0A1U7P138_9DEIO|nr:hypothetical protein BOO71_0004447 [Deinococcus marmoris]
MGRGGSGRAAGIGTGRAQACAPSLFNHNDYELRCPPQRVNTSL